MRIPNFQSHHDAELWDLESRYINEKYNILCCRAGLTPRRGNWCEAHMIVKCGLIGNESVHGVDATDREGRKYEIKIVDTSSYKGRTPEVSITSSESVPQFKRMMECHWIIGLFNNFEPVHAWYVNPLVFLPKIERWMKDIDKRQHSTPNGRKVSLNDVKRYGYQIIEDGRLIDIQAQQEWDDSAFGELV